MSKTTEITADDVKRISYEIKAVMTEKDVEEVLNKYDEYADADPTSNWTEIVETIIYEIESDGKEFTKEEAINMMNGSSDVKMSHEYFANNEFIYMKSGVIHDESGYKMELSLPNGQFINFWTDRNGSAWQTGWKRFK